MKLFALLLALSVSPYIKAETLIGQAAPDFSLPAQDGKTYKLSELSDQVVVLEWLNYSCPFVRKHYDSQNMQKLQTEMSSKKVKWFSIISSAPGKAGFLEASAAKLEMEKNQAHPTAVLLDTTGTVGKAYGAHNTPHMVVINKGQLAYQGAIDDRPSTELSDIPLAKNYVRQAVADLQAGRKVATAETKPYGCSVKY